MAWRRVASTDQVQNGQPLAVQVEGRELAIYLLGSRFHVLEDVCPHAYALLSGGFVEGDTVECPLHQAAFHIPTGKCLSPPATQDLQTFNVKVEGTDLLVDL